ncbi:Uma2 family endonuclease [Leptothoe spongobia]|uniref:Uma2 family endonuclease n=1 Tax=Leptothoe spongobia TAU-MAC 1115 TaxID=1967444 RepID=A0A947GHM5_9CYAN|nr:Uma2 family endonuclease [Leptothoe spongobia]MBT9315054.1 Uma2 family endonuclease [Leptothoe spongobia TAU-MAC 1115]
MSQTAERVRWKIRDLEVLPQSEGTNYELINGELFVTRSPHRRHQQVSGKFFAALDEWSEASGVGEAILAPGIIPSDTDNVIPDVVWISRQRLAVLEDEAGHLTGFPDLIVEVLSPGDSNIRRNRETKLKLYSVQSVQEYWIVEHRFTRQLEIYRRQQGQLALVATLITTDEATSPLLPDFFEQFTFIHNSVL